MCVNAPKRQFCPISNRYSHSIPSSTPLFFRDHAHPLDRTFRNLAVGRVGDPSHRRDVCARDDVITAH